MHSLTLYLVIASLYLQCDFICCHFTLYLPVVALYDFISRKCDFITHKVTKHLINVTLYLTKQLYILHLRLILHSVTLFLILHFIWRLPETEEEKKNSISLCIMLKGSPAWGK